MRVSVAAALALAGAILAPQAAGADRLVPTETVQQRLRGAAEARERDLSAVRDVLSRPEAASAAAALGADAERLKAAAATLSDAELQDLARRARALQTDPVAGLNADVNQLLIIFLVIAIVILVLQAVN